VPTGLAHARSPWSPAGKDAHVEVTTFRGEGTYTDARRPDHVTFGVPLVEDLGAPRSPGQRDRLRPASAR